MFKPNVSSLLILVLLCAACTKEDENITEFDGLFNRTPEPVFESSFGLAADPSVLMLRDTLFMYFAAEGGIAVVYSLDNGKSWMNPSNNITDDYLALKKRSSAWDNTLETPEVVKVDNLFYMYYTGYREGESDNEHVQNYEIGLATSQNGFDFDRISSSEDGPIINRNITDPSAFDHHALTSPGVIFEEGLFYMVYAGWNVSQNWTATNAGIRILGATSSDGRVWTKIGEPLLTSADIGFSPDVNEASLLKSKIDGYWLIPFSTDRSIGLARSKTFFGDFEVYPNAVIKPEFYWDNEVTAPDGIIQDGKLRLWFHGVKEPNYWPWVIGYEEQDYPFLW